MTQDHYERFLDLVGRTVQVFARQLIDDISPDLQSEDSTREIEAMREACRDVLDYRGSMPPPPTRIALLLRLIEAVRTYRTVEQAFATDPQKCKVDFDDRRENMQIIIDEVLAGRLKSQAEVDAVLRAHGIEAEHFSDGLCIYHEGPFTIAIMETWRDQEEFVLKLKKGDLEKLKPYSWTWGEIKSCLSRHGLTMEQISDQHGCSVYRDSTLIARLPTWHYVVEFAREVFAGKHGACVDAEPSAPNNQSNAGEENKRALLERIREKMRADDGSECSTRHQASLKHAKPIATGIS